MLIMSSVKLANAVRVRPSATAVIRCGSLSVHISRDKVHPSASVVLVWPRAVSQSFTSAVCSQLTTFRHGSRAHDHSRLDSGSQMTGSAKRGGYTLSATVWVVPAGRSVGLPLILLPLRFLEKYESWRLCTRHGHDNRGTFTLTHFPAGYPRNGCLDLVREYQRISLQNSFIQARIHLMLFLELL